MQSVEGTAFVRFVAPAASASVTASSRTAIKDAARLRTRHADATAPADSALARRETFLFRSQSRVMMLAPITPPTIPSATPLAALTAHSVHAALYDDTSVELVVRRALRKGTREGFISDAEERSVVASAVFGTAVLRARLSWMLFCVQKRAQEPARAGIATSDAKSRQLDASVLLLALFLLHEEPQRVKADSMRALLPPESLGLPAGSLRALSNLDVESIRWPSAVVPRLASRYSLPHGLVRMLANQDLRADEVAALARSFNRPGPVTLRANLRVLPAGRDELVKSLTKQGVACRAGELSPWSVVLEAGTRSSWGGSVWNLPAWKDGECELQDEGSQCVVLACEAAAGETVLDLCAGNGGKALALAALVGPSGAILAHDVVGSRLATLRASAERARVSPTIRTVATADDAWQSLEDPGGAKEELRPLATASRQMAPLGHDIVLVDAPCSSSGTLRRHPGLRWSGAWSDGGAMERRQLPALQLKLLRRAASFVRPGGRLVYATCSLDPAENEEVAAAFEADSGGATSARFVPWPFAEGEVGGHDATHAQDGKKQRAHCRTLWPHKHGTDGFFIARWRASPG